MLKPNLILQLFNWMRRPIVFKENSYKINPHLICKHSTRILVDGTSIKRLLFLCGFRITTKGDITKLRLNSVGYPTPSDKAGARLQS